MIYFNSDYLEGAHPRILARLAETNLIQTPGYGEDEYCERARGIIRELCEAPEADVHFLVGGTQVNATVLTAALRPYQGVVSADTGHIAVQPGPWRPGATRCWRFQAITAKSTPGRSPSCAGCTTPTSPTSTW